MTDPEIKYNFFIVGTEVLYNHPQVKIERSRKINVLYQTQEDVLTGVDLARIQGNAIERFKAITGAHEPDATVIDVFLSSFFNLGRMTPRTFAEQVVMPPEAQPMDPAEEALVANTDVVSEPVSVNTAEATDRVEESPVATSSEGTSTDGSSD